MTASRPGAPPPGRRGEAARLLARTSAGRRGGLTARLAADATAPAGRGPVRIGVLRGRPDPGVAGLLTGGMTEPGGAAESLPPGGAEDPVPRYGGVTAGGPGPPARGGVPVELLDIPAGQPDTDTAGAVRRLVGDCHAVLVVFPADALSTRPAAAPGTRAETVRWLRGWTEVLRALPYGPVAVYVATTTRRTGVASMPDLGRWLAARFRPAVGGPAGFRPLVHALAVDEAREVTALLAAAGSGAPGTVAPNPALVEQARIDRVGCGLAELSDRVEEVVRERAGALEELTRRRLAAAFGDVRLVCRDTAVTRGWPLGPLDGRTPPPGAPRGAGAVPAAGRREPGPPAGTGAGPAAEPRGGHLAPARSPAGTGHAPAREQRSAAPAPGERAAATGDVHPSDAPARPGPGPVPGREERWDRFETCAAGLLATRAGRRTRASPAAASAPDPGTAAAGPAGEDPCPIPDSRPRGREESPR
ncbi:hypothetical protein [Streptomyces sp. CAU 1734]|uniref:hypothetical protein n=1 Tax=Streptomyces sp. CAU 1734 TaxID=3140360 RepID=UPI0032617FEB